MLLNRVSAFLFYILVLTFFVAYILLQNGVEAPWAAWWLQVADLPLALSAVVFGGTSLYNSIRGERYRWLLKILIGLPLTALFLFLLVLNFWSLDIQKLLWGTGTTQQPQAEGDQGASEATATGAQI
ncbi:MAG: hypothetical protein Q7R81_06615 [Candidatus Peregrinibacteria bacterium]|nr:hypothetical protein [Candidatus Peregrinibacteria bacterium]